MKFLKVLCIPILIMSPCLGLMSYMAWKETKIQDNLVEHSLAGNSAAIAILVKYEEPWKLDERLVNEALAGNENAKKVLGICH